MSQSYRPFTNRTSRFLAVKILAVAVIGLALGLGTPAAAVTVGDSAPDFNLSDTGGRNWSMSSLSGRVVVLYFLGHNAGVCLSSGPDVEDGLRSHFADRGVQVLGIDCWNGTADQARRFAEQTGAEYPILMNGSGCGSDYDLPYHSFVVVDGRGIVRLVRVGPDSSAFDLATIQATVEHLLGEASTTTTDTWGAIKAIYGR